MNLKSYRLVPQLEFIAPQAAQRFEGRQALPLAAEAARPGAPRRGLRRKRAAWATSRRGACEALGAEVLVIAPQDCDEQRKRQVNDQLDAAVMCRRVERFLVAGSPILQPPLVPGTAASAAAPKQLFNWRRRAQPRS